MGFPLGISTWDFHLGFPFGSIASQQLHAKSGSEKNNNMLMRTQQIITIYPAATLRDCRRECFPYEFENKDFLTPLGFYSMFWKVKKKCKSRRQRDWGFTVCFVAIDNAAGVLQYVLLVGNQACRGPKRGPGPIWPKSGRS